MTKVRVPLHFFAARGGFLALSRFRKNLVLGLLPKTSSQKSYKIKIGFASFVATSSYLNWRSSCSLQDGIAVEESVWFFDASRHEQKILDELWKNR